MRQQRKEPKLRTGLLREVHRVAKIGTWEVTEDEELLWSAETLELFGVSPDDFTGSIDAFFDLVHPDDIEGLKRLEDFEGSQDDYFNAEYRVLHPDGNLRHMRQTAIVLRDPHGNPCGFSGMVQDVSDQIETEAKLRQAQKMETIGHLSGGVAHDFNNILAAIMGAAELLQYDKRSDRELVESIIAAAKRGGELTHRLLAFARKQPLRSTQVNVVDTICGIASMLDRLTGADIRLDLDLAVDTWLIDADPAPLEEALVNLTVNARDAIDGAGRITLSCRNRSAGHNHDTGPDYVEIALRDTGSGMTDPVMRQARDPFFTTKPVGKGSGLGLSMVDGFVKQSGGELRIDTTKGKGTTVSLLMPRSKTRASFATQTPGYVWQATTESVLVIEDNHELAGLLQKQLLSLNFQAVIATSRDEAFRAARENDGFDIVLCDIVLADGDRGPSVVTDLLALYPKICPVFMTGFAPETYSSLTGALAQQAILRKPFTLRELAATLHQAQSARTA